jgi:MinD superfamily P-loop ATPase
MLLGWASPRSLRIRFHRADFTACTDCRKCDEVCFMGVKPRSPKKDINCVNCAKCIISCREELGAEGGLFSLGFGERKEDVHVPLPAPRTTAPADAVTAAVHSAREEERELTLTR